MAAITWSVMADFDRDGTFDDDLTGFVEAPGSGIRIQRGIGRDGKPTTSKFSLTLSNRGGEFTPENTASAYYGLLEPGVPIRFTATHSATDYTICTGYAMRWQTSWAAGAVSMCQVECEDIFAILRDADSVNVIASDSRDTDGALIAVMDALGLVAGDRNFDDGVQNLPMHFAIGQNPLEAMMQVAASEMGGMLYPDATGRIRFEARNSRLGTTADDTWGDSTTITPVAVGYDLNPLELVTKVTARSTVFHEGNADTLLWEDSRNMFTNPATSLSLAAGEVYERVYQAKSAYVTLTALASTTDYLANSAADGSGTDQTASFAVTVTDLGGGYFKLRRENTSGSTIYNTKMRLRGQPVEFFSDRASAVFSLSQSGLKAGRNLEFDVPFAGDTGTTLRDYAYQELRVGRYPWPMLTLQFIPGNDDARAALLAAELGDLIQYTDTSLGAYQSPQVDDLWYIEGLDYTVPPTFAGQTFNCTVRLAPSYVYRNLDAIVFDIFDRDDASGDLGTSFSGDAWANDTGFDIASDAARANTDTLSIPDLDLGANQDDMVVEVQLAAIAAGDEVGVVLRKTDANNYLRAYVDKGSNEVILEEVVTGTPAELASPAFTVSTAHEIKAMVQDTRVRVWVNRILYVDATTSLTTGTKCGLMARNASGSTTFKNFYGQGL